MIYFKYIIIFQTVFLSIFKDQNTKNMI